MKKKSVYIFLFDGFADWEIAYLTPELRKSERISLKYFTMDGSNVKSMGGLHVAPDCSVNQIDPNQVSVLVLPGGLTWEKDSIKGMDELVEQLFVKNKVIGAICGATLFLARKGYLDNLKHTSNYPGYIQEFVKNYTGSIHYQEQFALADKNLITAKGIAPIEFAYELFKKVELFDADNLEKWFHLFKNGIWME